MTTPWIALVPAKPFARAKTRCAGLTPDARRSLAKAMLTDVVRRLRGVPAVHSVVVVTADPEVTGLALASGAAASGSGRFPGLNGEVGEALEAVGGAAPAAALALIMGDLAGAGTADYATALTLAARHRRAVVGDADGTGTTLLTLRDAADFRPFLGPGSLRRFHAAGYHDLGVGPSSPLRRDVDTVDHLLSLPPHTLGPATRQWLAAAFPPGGPRPGPSTDERRVGAL
ncbi:2-phospho-L-lactate guanylyltransferase [Streptomyces kebangsaanensis]|uniref:2-phospho-L-lactate guanylyltransferase n=1 Tax=Streptomyces kebangsaanensis TaxID=864058 RepID=UPI00093EEC00|nr:2-phospho-L-lactate guanylyltransferase [Streptomyces kebangsaanensis]